MGNINKRKIAFLINSLGRGGAERVITRIAPELNKRYDVTIILCDSNENIYECDLRIKCLQEEKEKSSIAYALSLNKKGQLLQKIIKEDNIELVISFLTVPNILNLKYNPTKKIISIRNNVKFDMHNGFFSKIKHIMEKYESKKADCVIVPSVELKKDFAIEYKYPSKKIVVINNPFNVKDIEKQSKDSVDLLFDKKTIVAMGRLNKQKGFEYLLKAYSLIDKINSQMIILGDGELKEDLQNVAREQNVSDRVIFMGGVGNPFKYIAKADVFVMSSLFEGFPNALVEAMACRVPVISTDCVSGPREILYDEPNFLQKATSIEYADYGVLVPEFDDLGDDNTNESKYKIMSEIIERFLVDDDLRERYAQKAIERANYFTLEKSVQGFSDVIESCLE